jgi:hypothetical protein
MQLSDQELRSLVRDAIARASGGQVQQAQQATRGSGVLTFQAHASHIMLPLARGAEGDGACLIEPAVRCNHCGYCLSFGH